MSGIVSFIYSLEWLDKDENVIDESIVDVVSGNANYELKNGNRRNTSITLKNLNKEYIPKPDSKMWINNKFRLKCGKEINGSVALYSQGTYVLGNPSILSNPSQKEVSLQGLDKWVLLDGTIKGTLQDKYIIPVDSRIDNVIKKLISEEAGETKYIIDVCETLVPYDVEKEAGNSLADIILELADIVSYEAYYDNNGYFRFHKNLQPEDYECTSASVTYTQSGSYLGSTRELQWDKVKNKIKVVGDTLDDGTIITATAQDESTGIISIGAVGELFELIEDTNIYTNELAQQRANYELKQRIMFAESVSMTIIPEFERYLEEIVEVIDANNGCEGNYVIQGISYNLGYSSEMQLNLWKVRDWR